MQFGKRDSYIIINGKASAASSSAIYQDYLLADIGKF
jgi:hypothetical protein